MLNLRQVEAFVAAAEEGSMTAAAERLQVSQSAVSLAVAGLERTLGTVLFLRHRGRGLTPTSAGRELLLPARNLMADADAMLSQADVIGRGLSGRLTVGCFGTGAPLVLPALMETFERRYPGMVLDFVEGSTDVLESALLEGRCEIALMYDVGLHIALVKEPLYATVPYALFAPEHPLAGRPSVMLTELAAYDFVALDVQPVHEHQLGLFAYAGVSPQIRYRTSSYELLRSLVARNLGFTLLISRPYGDLSYEGRPLVAVPLSGEVKTVEVMLARAPGVRPTMRAQAFAAHCRELLPELSSYDKSLVPMPQAGPNTGFAAGISAADADLGTGSAPWSLSS
ncbi:MAG TPA: LysR family transcriptional regulator [Solirubrobacteraceae bacterium]|nr:LysR family transcriptional regulator [Solirubrobacteraceae bacterium]